MVNNDSSTNIKVLINKRRKSYNILELIFIIKYSKGKAAVHVGSILSFLCIKNMLA